MRMGGEIPSMIPENLVSCTWDVHLCLCRNIAAAARMRVSPTRQCHNLNNIIVHINRNLGKSVLAGSNKNLAKARTYGMRTDVT